MEPTETPTAVLREEHRVILDVVGVLADLLDRGVATGTWDFDALDDCVRFFRLFTDACHHGKEEDLLFPELVTRGLPDDAGPIAVMLEEHRRGRALVGRMAEALEGARRGDPEKREALRRAGEEYIDLLRGHILKEDDVLFEMADQLVEGAACRELCRAYGVVCRGHFEGRSKEELERLAGELVRRSEAG